LTQSLFSNKVVLMNSGNRLPCILIICILTLAIRLANGQTGIIAQQPVGLEVPVGSKAEVSVALSGNTNGVSFQWFENGTPISGATNQSYTTEAFNFPTQKVYTVTIHYPNPGFGQTGIPHENSPLLAVSSTPAVVSFYNLDVDGGLLAHWTFDEPNGSAALDFAGGFNGEVVNAERIVGPVGGALEFNGQNSRVYVGAVNTALQLTNTHYTIAWWQRWDGPTASHQNVFAMEDGADYSGGYQVFIYNGSSSLHAVHSNGQDPLWPNMINLDREWHHLAITYNGQERSFFVDGLLHSTRPTQSPIRSDQDDPFVIGAMSLQNGALVNFFDGALDDVRIYTRALHIEEIARLGPEPTLEFSTHPKTYRLGLNETVTISGSAFTRAISAPITFQWQKDGAVIGGATNATLAVTAGGGTNHYRLVARAGEFEAVSDEATITTVIPDDGRLLLHLEFESANNGIFSDSSGNVTNIVGNGILAPGRVGQFAVSVGNDTQIRIPAAGTDLELVGTSYTIAWWMKVPPTGIAQIYSLGEADNTDTGYGARLEGSGLQRGLRTAHRGGSATILTPLRGNTNWMHIAIVYNGITRAIYTNGVAAATPITTSVDVRASGQDDLYIGGMNLTSSVGLVDDFRIYNYALATDELRDLANAPMAAPHLTIESAQSSAMIRWPILDQTQHRLEYATSLNSETWTPLSAPIGTTQFFYEVQQPLAGEFRFYRLRNLQ
jgi:hypothetical protein